MSTLKGISESLNNIRDLDKNSKAKKGDKVKDQKSSGLEKSGQKAAVSKDSVNISNLARELMNKPLSVETLQQELDSIKTLDRPTLKEIHGKIESNYYDKPEVIDKIVDGIIPEAHPMEEVLKPAEAEETERLAMIRENIEEGKYDSEEVLDKIVDRILNPDNLMF